MKTHTLTPELLHKMDACWRAANYLSIGQMYFDPTLFMRADQVEAARQILMPVLKAADELLAREERVRRPIV